MGGSSSGTRIDMLYWSIYVIISLNDDGWISGLID